jgi:hypothetical protein
MDELMDLQDDIPTSPAPILDNPIIDNPIITTQETAIVTTPAVAGTFKRPATKIKTPKSGQTWESSSFKANQERKQLGVTKKQMAQPSK